MSTTPIRFVVPAVPVAQPRPRVVTFNGKARAVSAPQRHPVTAFKATCRLAAAEAYQGPPLDGPLSLSVVFVLPRPARLTRKRGDNPRVPHDRRPDADNLLKALKDSLGGVVWRDDAQVHACVVFKWYAACGEAPHVEVEVTT